MKGPRSSSLRIYILDVRPSNNLTFCNVEDPHYVLTVRLNFLVCALHDIKMAARYGSRVGQTKD